MLSSEFRKKNSHLAVSFFLFFFLTQISFSQDKAAAAIFILKGQVKSMAGKASEGVEMELKKNGQTISKYTTGKNGKYYIQMDVSTTNLNNEYILTISQAGTIPKLLSINTYISPEEFKLHTYARYDYELEIKMIETKMNDIVLEKPSGKIHWDNTEHKFLFDQSYAKIAQKEEDKMKDENYLRELAVKKKKEEDDAAKKKADEDAKSKADADAKAKADEEAKKLAEQKTKEETDRVLQQNLEAMRQELKRKHAQDSLDSLARLKTAKTTTVEITKLEKPISPENVDQNAFDGTDAYSINSAMKVQKVYKEKMNREKAQNLFAKYETSNVLTSLLDVVDEEDKKLKKQ